MTTFDLVQVQDFVASLDARMGPDLDDARDNHAALAVALREHGELCHEFTEKVREWGRTVFCGRIELDLAVETVVRAEGARLAARAEDLRRLADQEVVPGAQLGSQCDFQTAVDRMNKLLDHWVRPQLAVGPGPRHWQHVTPEMVAEAQRRIAALPPLPADWRPNDPDQRARFEELRNP